MRKNWLDTPSGRQLVVGDIHGCFITFVTLIEEQLKLQQDDQLILLGDVINKGANSRKVLDYLMQLQLEYEVHCVKGNHEHNLLTAYACGMDFFEDFLHTYHSDDLMEGDVYAYLDFCANMRYYLETPTHIFSHLGFSQQVPYPITDTRAYFHGQKITILQESIETKQQIHGHMTTSLDSIQYNIAEKVSILNIDGGCYYSEIEGLGHLCALDTRNRKLYIQKNVETNISIPCQFTDILL